MPLFEYRCQDCDHGFELLVRESTTLECPACHGAKLEKQLSVFAVGADGAAAPDAGGGRPLRRVRPPRRPGLLLGELTASRPVPMAKTVIAVLVLSVGRRPGHRRVVPDTVLAGGGDPGGCRGWPLRAARDRSCWRAR